MTAEAKRRKNQKKKLKQKQKKQAEKVAADNAVQEEIVSPLVDGSAPELVENSEIVKIIQEDQGTSIDESLEKKVSDQVTFVESLPAEESQDEKVSEEDDNVLISSEESSTRNTIESPSIDENVEIIKSIQQDQGTGIDEVLQRRLSETVTILEDLPTKNTEEGETIEADHNIVLPTTSNESDIIKPIQQDLGTSTDKSLNEKLSQQVTGMKDKSTRESGGEKLFEADHNIVLPESNNFASGGTAQEPETPDQPTDNALPIPVEQNVHTVLHFEPTNEITSATLPSVKASDKQDDTSAHDSEADISPEDEAELQLSKDSSEPILPEDESSHVLNTSQAQEQEAKQLFVSETNEGQEKMPWETDGAPDQAPEQDESNDQSVKTQGSTPSELFTSYGDDNSEKMPWETSEGNGSDSKQPITSLNEPSGYQEITHTSDLFATVGNGEHEKMPWEAAPSNTDLTQTMNESNNQMNDEVTEHSDQLFTNDDIDENEKMPWESDDRAALEFNEPASQENEVACSNSHLSGSEKLEVTVTTEQANVDKLAQIFGDDEAEEDDWLNNRDFNNASVPISSDNAIQDKQDAQPTAGQPAMKFSFLEEDDDLLDENLSDDASLLPSDDDHEPSLAVDQTPNAGTTNNVTATQSIDEVVQEMRPPSVSSATSSNHRSKYEPQQTYKQAQQALPSAAYRAPVSTGIVTPQFPLQPSPSQPPKAVETREVVEKINEAKKKSDAYDFPMDLFPKKTKLAHAKPVGTPTPIFPTAASHQIPARNSSIPQIGPNGQFAVRDRSGSAASLPKNPYANLAAPPQAKAPPQIPMPPQGIVQPHVNLPSAHQPVPGQPVVPSMIPQSSVPFSPSTVRTRGFSNTSTGEAFSSRAPSWASGQSAGPAEPINAPQPPRVAKKPTATRYAPVTTAHPQNIHTPKKGVSLNTGYAHYRPQLPLQSTAFPGAQAPITQKADVTPLVVNVPNTTSPSDLISPASGSSTRRYHARSNSSVYTPNQTEYTAKYAPTVHPQYQNTLSAQQPQLPGQIPAPHLAPTKPGYNNLVNNDFAVAMPEVDQPVDNQALLHRQFPLVHLSASNKVIYAIPQAASHSSYLMGPDSSLQFLKIVPLDFTMPGSNLLKSFPGPLVKNKTKNKDVEKWIESIIGDYQESTVEYTLLSLLKLKLTGTATWKDVSQCLYDSDEMLSYLSQPMVDSKSIAPAQKLDPNGQMRIVAYLQTGGRDKALTMALQSGDFAMALLIGSLMGKDKWSEVVQHYLASEFKVDSDVSHFSTNLLSLVFQVFVGNSKAAVMEFYSVDKSQWACDNWRIITAAVLNNIGVNEDGTQLKTGELPPVVHEFLVEYGVFLSQRGLISESCVVFVLANLPLCPSPVASSPVRFAQIGSPMSLEGCIFSEIYEFVSCPDVKGYSTLISSKLYHAFCLQEHGLSSSASRYADYLTCSVKLLPKRESLTLNVASGLNELSTRIAGSSTGWLGKPKLSSVWGQLDKSFNKYIGGDDDSLIKKSSEKKVFDGFTPVPSRNSSTVDVSQYQFTPAQNAQYSTDGSVAFPPVGGSPMNNAIPTFAPPRNPLSRTLTEQGPPKMPSSFSVDSSPQQLQRKQSLTTTGNRLRRTRTEQTTAMNFKADHTSVNGFPPQELSNYGMRNNSSATDLAANTDLAPSPQLSRSSPHHSSTPELLPGRSSVLSSTLLPLKPINAPAESRPSELPAPMVATSAAEPEIFDPIHAPTAHQKGTRGFEPKSREEGSPYLPNNYSQVSITGLERIAQEGGLTQDDTFKPHIANNNGVLPTAHGQYLNGNEEEFSDEQADTTVLHKSLSQLPSEHAIDSGSSFEPEISQAPEAPVEHIGDFMSPPNPAFQQDSGFAGPSENNEHQEPGKTTFSKEPSQFAGPISVTPQISVPPVVHNKNPYAPSTFVSPLVTENQFTTPIVQGTKTNAYSVDKSVDSSEEPRQDYVPSRSAGSDASETSLPAKQSEFTGPRSRFDPIKPAEALSPEAFVPVIKKTPVSRAFTPLVVQPPEVQYDDVVEDESDDEDEDEQKRLREKQEQERREKEEDERRKKEKEKARAAKANSKEDDKASGWFSWLKKDPNEKKPVKAKLGHKTTFYYDEKLKRWVNKDASEEEKEKITSPPPPPPIVKKMDNGPKTKPMTSPDVSTRDMAGAVFPNNPITGAPLGSPSPSKTPSDSTPLAPAPSAPISSTSHPGINLSGKKANGLDDLLSLTGGSAPRRKKKPGRGYVNVMDNK